MDFDTFVRTQSIRDNKIQKEIRIARLKACSSFTDECDEVEAEMAKQKEYLRREREKDPAFVKFMTEEYALKGEVYKVLPPVEAADTDDWACVVDVQAETRKEPEDDSISSQSAETNSVYCTSVYSKGSRVSTPSKNRWFSMSGAHLDNREVPRSLHFELEGVVETEATFDAVDEAHNDDRDERALEFERNLKVVDVEEMVAGFPEIVITETANDVIRKTVFIGSVAFDRMYYRRGDVGRVLKRSDAMLPAMYDHMKTVGIEGVKFLRESYEEYSKTYDGLRAICESVVHICGSDAMFAGNEEPLKTRCLSDIAQAVTRHLIPLGTSDVVNEVRQIVEFQFIDRFRILFMNRPFCYVDHVAFQIPSLNPAGISVFLDLVEEFDVDIKSHIFNSIFERRAELKGSLRDELVANSQSWICPYERHGPDILHCTSYDDHRYDDYPYEDRYDYSDDSYTSNSGFPCSP